MLSPKKADHPFARQHRYLNYGLCELASVLDAEGYAPVVCHGRFSDPTTFARDLARRGLFDTPHPMLLSVPSVFALSWAHRFTTIARELQPELTIVAGGRWTIGDDAAWFLARVPSVDRAESGFGEAKVLGIVDPASDEPVTTVTRDSPAVNMRLVDQGTEYHPSLEVSRGCGMGCSFCAEANDALGNMKPPEACIAELLAHIEYYGHEAFHPYFEASLFRPTTAWVHSFAEQYNAERLSVEWRTETRVDSVSVRMLPALARAGLRVIDLGLESAAPTQLRAMGKTRVPETYLRKADEVLTACADQGIWVKVNILLYPGETDASVSETREWLHARAHLIKGVSAYPLIVYRYPNGPSYLKSLSALGAGPVREGDLEESGYSMMHLSSTISAEQSVELSSNIAREFMTAKDYFDLKAFSYFPRHFTFANFEALLNATNEPHRLPFDIGSTQTVRISAPTA